MKTVFATAISASALVVGSLAGPAQAHNLVAPRAKSPIPYYVPHSHPGGGYVVRNASECPRTVIRRIKNGRTALYCPDK